MSALDTWMPLYISDYQRDTADLTLEQSGAYLHLLMRYWVSGPLPDDDTRLAAILGVSRTHFVRHIGAALRPYFTCLDGKLCQGRADAEREKRAKIAEKRAENGRKFSENSAKNSPKSDHVLNDINASLEANGATNAEQMPPTSTSTVTVREESKEALDRCSLSTLAETPKFEAAPVGASDADFERFWSAYPRKVSKGAARKAWRLAVRKVSPDAILSAVLSVTWKHSEYDPHPATWLNGERWLDVPALTLNQRLALMAEAPPAQAEDYEMFATFPTSNIVRLHA